VGHQGNTRPFRGPDGHVLLGSIAEIRYLRLGGLDQWVMIRGASVANPPLVLLHGGPGFLEAPLFRHFNSALEQFFTVVYWQQRGTNKSYERTTPKDSMTVEQFIVDLNELVDAVRAKLGKSRVVIYGHSWGSALGVLYASRFPEKVAAYVGAGQIGDWPASEVICYNFTLTEAKNRNKRKALRQLRAIGPPPHTYRRMMVQRKWLTRFVGMVRGMSMWRLSHIMISGPESSVLDFPNILRGTLFSTQSMWDQVSKLNLVKTVPTLKMPVFFFIGRHDRVIAPETSVAYFDALEAPSKTLVWFEESAHEPPFEEPEKFNAVMAEMVCPAAGD
jgi:pimeloyl-ACP methyl ester carboxylesterase